MTLIKIAALVAIASLGATGAALAASPFKAGEYKCFGGNKQHTARGFATDAKGTYQRAGKSGGYTIDKGLNAVVFDTGERFFIGGPDRLIVITDDGRMSNIGCLLQKR